ncbi:putative transketolase [Neolecta irregularis DAH-3]|uniref:Transketolase n=1 Tax=Neolecta irregularis (strain DAH-3) TaxID=1198029 RepID=A0A1U7LNA7_NEOID|nr:putative transketolase [Neolecta irregularis DAH-3]|eukprot:OLL24134.1 putative transketolase [Neolecta irregularis DAH-3]
MSFGEIDQLCINTIRILAVDMTFQANSGHPGAPMGLAPVAHVLFNKFMKFNPKNPKWANRDRFVLSNGHACALQYILLHLYGYDMTMEDLKNFRQVNSKTPGHPENHISGIEVTTGPLGQGFSNAVGLALAQTHTSATFNKDQFDVINNYTYVFTGDGCLMEGVASEAASLAGHLKLGNLICIYDDNHISIDGDTNCAFTEDVDKRFEAYGWQTFVVEKGDTDLESISAAIEKARKVRDKPSIIRLRTTIGFGSKIAGTGKVHGSPLSKEDAMHVKSIFGFDSEKSFQVPDIVYEFYRKTATKGAKVEKEWNILFSEYENKYSSEAAQLKRRLTGKLPEGWEKSLPTYSPEDKAIASRTLSQTIIEKLAHVIPEFICGSADLTGSNLTRWKDAVDFQHPSTGLGDYSGRYVRYGVREHAMAGLMNGMAAYGTIIPAGGTFLNFISYAAGSVRLSALSHHQVIYIATHDSIGLGEDGPTHQPIETMAHFRALPNMMVWRPADGNETSAAYYIALTERGKPTIMALSRQNLPQLSGSTIGKAIKGGYTLLETHEKADITLISTGSEVGICVDAVKILKMQGIKARVVSLPCWEVFDTQSKDYKLSVLPDDIPILSVEVYSTLGWEKYSHEQFGINTFGASGPYKDVYKKYDFIPEGIAKRAAQTVEFWKDVKPIRSPLNRAFEQLI